MTALADPERTIRLWGETVPREVVSESLAERWPGEGGPVRYVVTVVGGTVSNLMERGERD